MAIFLETQTEKYFTNERITFCFLNGFLLFMGTYEEGNRAKIKLMNLQTK